MYFIVGRSASRKRFVSVQVKLYTRVERAKGRQKKKKILRMRTDQRINLIQNPKTTRIAFNSQHRSAVSLYFIRLITTFLFNDFYLASFLFPDFVSLSSASVLLFLSFIFFSRLSIFISYIFFIFIIVFFLSFRFLFFSIRVFVLFTFSYFLFLFSF